MAVLVTALKYSEQNCHAFIYTVYDYIKAGLKYIWIIAKFFILRYKINTWV